MVSLKEYRAATERAKMLQATRPMAVDAAYDSASGKVRIHFNDGREFGFFAHSAQGLENASTSELSEIEISPSGFEIYFPRVDVDLDIPELMLGHFGSKRWMATALGAAGGRSTSLAKKRAAQANGVLGGRPKVKKANAG